jgi:hypothetical protein
MYVCMFVCMYLYMYLRVSRANVCTVHMYLCMYVCMYVRKILSTSVCLHVCNRNHSELHELPHPITTTTRTLTLRTQHNGFIFVSDIKGFISRIDSHIPYVREVFQERIDTHRTAIASHPNRLMAPLLHSPTKRRLKRRWTLDGTH